MRIALMLFAIAAAASGCGRCGFQRQPLDRDAQVGTDGGRIDAGRRDAGSDAGRDAGAPPLTFGDLCGPSQAVAIDDGVTWDLAAGMAIASGIAGGCHGLAIAARSQDAFGVLETGTDRPNLGPETIMAIGGGEDRQRAVRYLNGSLTPVEAVQVGGIYRLTERATGASILDWQGTTSSATHDVAIVQVVREPVSGTLVVIGYGYRMNGTVAAGFWFGSRLSSQLGSERGSYYVIEWTDGDGNSTPSAGDTFAVRGSG